MSWKQIETMKIDRLLAMPRKKKNRLYKRWLRWCTFMVGRKGKQIPRSEVREMGLAIRRFNNDYNSPQL